MRSAIVWMLLGCAAFGCGAGAIAELEVEVERPALSFTDWTEQTELFVELPALVVGIESPCAAHLTRLSDFSPLAEGRVTAVLRAADGSEERFEVNEVLRTGIFRPVIVPRSAGLHQLRFEVHAESIDVVHRVGEVEVYPSIAASAAALGADAATPSGRIVFLKEQQWVMPFGTERATTRALRPSMSVLGVIEARPEGDVTVRSPAAGRVLADGFPHLGDEVVRDGVLAGLAPRLEAADRASLDLARSAAGMDLALAERERQRLEGLRAEGAVPERRVAEAMHAEEEARAALNAASRRAPSSIDRSAPAVAARARSRSGRPSRAALSPSTWDRGPRWKKAIPSSASSRRGARGSLSRSPRATSLASAPSSPRPSPCLVAPSIAPSHRPRWCLAAWWWIRRHAPRRCALRSTIPPCCSGPTSKRACFSTVPSSN